MGTFFSFACTSTSYLAYHSLCTSSSSAKKSSLRLKYCKLPSKLRSEFTVFKRAQSKFELKLNSSDENEMILKQNLDVVVQKYIGMISFVFHFLKCIGFSEKIKKNGGLRCTSSFLVFVRKKLPLHKQFWQNLNSHRHLIKCESISISS